MFQVLKWVKWILSAEMISALSIHLTSTKTWNRVYNCWMRPELQHDVIRCPDHCITKTAWRDITSWAPNRLTSLKSQTRDPQLKVPPGGLVLMSLRPEKNPSTSARFQPANLGSRGEHVTPRPPRSTKQKIHRVST